MTYRIGLIGLEQHVERVFGAVDNDPEIALTAVANAGERAAELAKTYQAAIHDDFHDLLARDDIDVVASFQLPVHQGETVIAALEAGFPVLAEKPMVTSQNELDRVIEILQQNPSLHVGQLFSRRGNPVYRAVREVVNSGQIGEGGPCVCIDCGNRTARRPAGVVLRPQALRRAGARPAHS